MFDQIQTYKDVPGFINFHHCEQILELGSTLPKNAKVLEIGCAWGRSTWCWLESLSSEATLITVDSFVLGNPRKQKFRQKNWYNNPIINNIMNFYLMHGLEETWKRITSSHPNSDILELHVSDSTAYVPTLDYFDCVYIDANHKYPYIKSDLNNFEPMCDIICGDDYSPPHPDVKKAVNEMLEETGRKIYEDYPNSGFWIARK